MFPIQIMSSLPAHEAPVEPGHCTRCATSRKRRAPALAAKSLESTAATPALSRVQSFQGPQSWICLSQDP